MRIIVDSREQTPWTFPADIEVATGTLQSGDYSLAGFENEIAAERKSLSDFLGCLTSGRERFKHELHRLRGFTASTVVIEADMGDILAGNYRSRINPEAVLGVLAAWPIRYPTVHFVLVGDASVGMRYCVSFFKNYLRIKSEAVRALEAQGMPVSVSSAATPGIPPGTAITPLEGNAR